MAIQELLAIQSRLLAGVPKKFKRSLYGQIDWEDRLIEITGARGTGKTTLLLQKVAELKRSKIANPLYVTAEDPYFYKNTLYDLAQEFYRQGGTHMFIDEIHRYPPKVSEADWSKELKYIYDVYPSLHIVFSGSSAISLYKGQGDLSRRKISYLLNGLSFREFLELKYDIRFLPVLLEQLLANHVKLSEEIATKYRILKFFSEYLRTGYYPFFREERTELKYFLRVRNVLNVVIENDLPAVSKIRFQTIPKLKKLFAVIATSSPYTVNLRDFLSQLNIKDYETLLNLLYMLEKAELLTLLSSRSKGVKILHKPDKIYLNNTNLMYALDFGQINIGTVRETFFLNQLSYKHTVRYPKTVDFLVDDKWLFEIGGKNKTQKQIAGHQEAYIAADDIEIGFGNKIPLWLFGFLY